MKPQLSWSERLWSQRVGWAGCGEVELGRGYMLATYRGGSSLLASGAAKVLAQGCMLAPTGRRSGVGGSCRSATYRALKLKSWSQKTGPQRPSREAL